LGFSSFSPDAPRALDRPFVPHNLMSNQDSFIEIPDGPQT